ncbi:hypothetical protein GH714_010042 [Hevea brasiliensis]|uniref:CCHC-type domain-containing protein n=1 Tax=Hevea brasiliensis TaxID=3981 RepID=A0A6A6NGD7_HEVBR|nr:hypothetical protein GH714_010042 [Hevea brasiliensis]
MTALLTTRNQQPAMGFSNSNGRGRRGGRGNRGGKSGGRFQNYQMPTVQPQQSQGQFFSSATCYNCNGSGHIARQCPSQRRTVLPPPQAYHTVSFRKFVETFFDRKIKMFQCDWGGEFRSLATYLADNGISLRLSCPYTPQQNGCAERKHRHIVETGLAMLNFATLPLDYWDFAFETAAYVINRIVTPLIHKSPYEKLFGALPDLSSLRTFGCLCYPYLRPYNKHKLENRSSPCIFLGYSLVHKGYKCYDFLAKRLYISRHVVFDEHNFPFKSLKVQDNNVPESVHSSRGILGPPPVHLLPKVSSQREPNVVSNTEIISVASGSDSEPLPAPISNLSDTQLSPMVQPDQSVIVLPLPAPLGNTHPMLTRSKTGHSKPRTLSAITPPLQPATVTEAKRFKEWLNRLAQYMHRPTEEHWQAVKRVLRYLQGTAEYGLLLRPSSVYEISAYSDSDWAGSIEDRKSTTGFAIYLGRNLVSWRPRNSEVFRVHQPKQNTVPLQTQL